MSATDSSLNHRTSPGSPSVLNSFTAESCDTFQDNPMSETDSCRESPDISRISKYHLTGSLLNLITPHRTSKCQKQIPVENHRTSLGFPSIIKQVHY